ncbi:MAG: hypothetical protein L6Q57_00075 [Alphaproteobacteria bacterium]|nr:hypothetical protein [Alphaproteobacteria bacterium]
MILLALVIGFVALVFAITIVKMARAEEDAQILEGCPAPISGDLSTDAVTSNCDMYMRQIEYGDERAKFRENLDKRREDYAKPRAEALKKYNKALEERDKSATNDQDEKSPDLESDGEKAKEQEDKVISTDAQDSEMK